MPVPKRMLYGAGLIYTHVLNKGGRGVKSPLDRIGQPVAEYCAA